MSRSRHWWNRSVIDVLPLASVLSLWVERTIQPLGCNTTHYLLQSRAASDVQIKYRPSHWDPHSLLQTLRIAAFTSALICWAFPLNKHILVFILSSRSLSSLQELSAMYCSSLLNPLSWIISGAPCQSDRLWRMHGLSCITPINDPQWETLATEKSISHH